MYSRSLTVLIAALLLAPASLRADTVWVGGEGRSPVPFVDVRVLRIEADQLVFRTGAGVETSRPLAQIAQLEIDGATGLNSAEQAYAAGRWDEAAEAYQQARQEADQDWTRQWVALRLMETANRTGRFDAAVSAFVALAENDAELAERRRPAVPPDADAEALNAAAAELSRSIMPGMANPQRRALLGLLLEVHRARGDAQAAGSTAQRLLPLVEAQAGDPAADRAMADLRLSLAHLAVDQGEFQDALEEIESNRGLFTEPRHQATALYLLAEARYGLVRDSEPADADALKDSALGYMRVVAHFGETPERPYVAEALLRTAEIHERLDEPRTAMRLYQEVASQFADRRAGLEANESIQRLRELEP